MAELDDYSVTSLPLELLCKGAIIATATGFFCVHEDRLYLASNWHVFSGRNAGTGQACRPDAALPDAVRVWVHKDKLGVAEQATFPLVSPEGVSLWRQHPLGQKIDVALLPLSPMPLGFRIYKLPKDNETEDMKLSVGMDTFILGFPLGMAHQKVLPIWKRASVATEPDIPYDGLPLFLVDTATREGMSGSPVVLRSTGYLSTTGDFNLGSRATKFLGVYSGRLGVDVRDPLGVQLGCVWHASVLFEIARAGVPGSYELR